MKVTGFADGLPGVALPAAVVATGRLAGTVWFPGTAGIVTGSDFMNPMEDPWWE